MDVIAPKGRNEMCVASGPGKDMYDSCEIIGNLQFQKAQELFQPSAAGAGTVPLVPAAGPGSAGSTVDFIHTYVEMPGTNVTDPVTGALLGTLCTAARGQSFAAGTTDGPGAFDFAQGSNSTNPFWPFIANVLHKSTPEERACQSPKDILLATGSIKIPHQWGPSTLPVQILRVGQLVMLVMPTELTTMAGRRMRDRVKDALVAQGVVGADAMVVISGLSNGYAGYTTTWEEYQAQRYEAGSTIFGSVQVALKQDTWKPFLPRCCSRMRDRLPLLALCRKGLEGVGGGPGGRSSYQCGRSNPSVSS